MTSIKKRAYSAPELVSVKIDREITLVMATENWGLGAPDGSSVIEEKTIGKEKNAVASPFGGDKPDFSNL